MRFITYTLFLAVMVFGGWMTGCAPLPPLEEPSATVESQSTTTSFDVDEDQRKMMIGMYRSFAYERWKSGDWKVACRHIDTVRVYDINHEQNIYRQWTDCLIKLSYMDSAGFAYEEGIKYFPEDDYLRSSLAILYRNQGNIEDAITQQIAAIDIVTKRRDENKDDAANKAEFDKAQTKLLEYLPNLADMYESIEDWDLAIQTYESILKINPDDANTRNRLTNLIRIHRDPEEYLAALKKDIELFPDDPTKRVTLAKALFEQGHSEQAVTEYESAIKAIFKDKTPETEQDFEIFRNMARAQENLGQYAAAIKTLEKISNGDQASLPLRDMISVGKNYLTLKNWTRARNIANTALNKSPDYGPAYLLMADVYYSSADKTSGDSPKYNDKIVFAISYGLYLKAARSSDPDASSDGERLAGSMKGSILLPSREERFMRMKVTRPTGEDYSWINKSWSEVKYIDNYLKSLD